MKYLRLKANGISSVFYDGLGLINCINDSSDIILLLGVSGSIFLPILKPFLKSKIICNIDGIEWKRNKWNSITRKFLKISESIAIKYSDIIIADNEGISLYIKNNYNCKCITIAYGADEKIEVDDKLLHSYSLLKNNYFFKVCRI